MWDRIGGEIVGTLSVGVRESMERADVLPSARRGDVVAGKESGTEGLAQWSGRAQGQ